MQRTSW